LPVIGLVGNARLTGMRNGDDAILYMPLAESKKDSAVMLVRTAQPPQLLTATVTGMARAIDPSLSPNVQMLATAFHERLGDSEKFAGVVGGMGALALMLAIVGLYGVVAYGVAQRTREIGIRIALGATPSGLVQNMLSSFLLPLGIAIVAGLGVAAVLSTIMREILYGVSNWDPLSYGGSVMLLAMTGSVAALIPARRATKVDPMVALRCE